MSKNSNGVKNWRKTTKIKIVQSMGGKCQICNYDKCYNALELHHINPSEKDIEFGKIIANPRKWEIIKEELNKCILLCCRCHREIHANVTEIPKNFQKFDDSKIKIKDSKCKVCKKNTHYMNTTCSRSCAAKLTKNAVEWENIDLEQKLKEMTPTQISIELSISIHSVMKRIKRLNINLEEIRKKYPEIYKKQIILSSISRRKVERPDKEFLLKLVDELPFTQIGKKFNVSDNCIRKWCKFYNIEKPIRCLGYWQKLKHDKL